ncbi:hypothetical protein CBS101457_001829 [Exobasidium rhododendri]|nr:hypothetical protein CBS101457_001829 [Exobasidium rhododendri]
METSIIFIGALAALLPLTDALELPKFLQPAKEYLSPLSPWEKTYEYKVWKLDLKFRPIDFKIEAALLAVSVFYLLFHFAGKARNRALAKAWLQEAMPMLEDEFAYVGKEEEIHDGHKVGQGEGKGRLVWNGAAEALAYASGRRGVTGLQILFTLKPMHDPIQLIYNLGSDFATAALVSSSRDLLTLTFLLPYQGADNVSGVFALVNKTALRSTRKGRFDLTFTKVIDTDNANEQRELSPEFAIMSETAELTDAILGDIGEKGSSQRHRVGLQSAVNSEAGKLLYSLVLSDQPQKRPEESSIPVEKRQRTLTLTLRAPRNSREAKASLNLLETACNLVDVLELGHAKLTNVTLQKLRNTRTAIDKEINEEANKWQKEEDEEARQSAKKKAEQDKFDKLSPAEQEKRKQVEKKRQMRKSQGKQAKAR